MVKCPRCGDDLVKDARSIRCSNLKCMYHLNKKERIKFYEKIKDEKRKKTSKSNNKAQSSGDRAKRYYYRKKGLQMGFLTVEEAAKLKGVTNVTILNSLHLFHIKKRPLRIKFDSNLINCKIKTRKRRLRRK